MNISKAIKFLDKQISNPSEGLPEDIFLFISKLVPMINVDLLIKDEDGRTLLAWRDDQYSGIGWHLPGGIIRFKEDMKKRVQKVIETEIGTEIEFEDEPIAINQTILNHKTRGHFISLLYKCFLSNKFIPKNIGLKESDGGYLKWYNSCPENLIKVHDIYKKFIREEKFKRC